MPDQPDIRNRVLSLRIPREFYQRLHHLAALRKMKFNESIRHIIYEATGKITLTKEDYEQIKREMQQDLDRARAKRRLSKSRKGGGTVGN
jgi:hypothetical protein